MQKNMIRKTGFRKSTMKKVFCLMKTHEKKNPCMKYEIQHKEKEKNAQGAKNEKVPEWKQQQQETTVKEVKV